MLSGCLLEEQFNGQNHKTQFPLCDCSQMDTWCTLGKSYTLHFNNVIADDKTLSYYKDNFCILNHNYIPPATFNKIKNHSILVLTVNFQYVLNPTEKCKALWNFPLRTAYCISQIKLIKNSEQCYNSQVLRIQ